MKKIAIFFICLFLVLKLSAQVISYSEAKQLASSFFLTSDKIPRSLRSATTLKIDSFATYYTSNLKLLRSTGQSQEPVFYIFNRIDKPGFVIVSGDVRIKKIIAYSNSSSFCTPNPSLQELLNSYVSQISYAKENNVTGIENVDLDYSTNFEDSWLLNDIEWNQSPDPYNTLCPPGTVTGCVATAMAQIIYYYRFPRFGNSEFHYETDYRIEKADFQNTEYIYDSMVNKPVVGKTNEQIATLLYHCGVSVKMMYSASGSGSWSTLVPWAFELYFNFKKSQYLSQSDYDWDSWKQLIKTEIDNKRPIYYGVSKSQIGHAIVIDGYNNFDQYHTNWGWGGSSNGYYSLSLLNGWNNNQNMIIGIEPDTSRFSIFDGSVLNKNQTFFYKCPLSKAGSYSFPQTVTGIGKRSFAGCNQLTSIIFPSLLNSINSQAFRNCSGLTSIYSFNKIPIDLNLMDSVFYGVNKNICILYVPYGSKTLYISSSQWKDFSNIIEMPKFEISSSSINIKAEEGSTATVKITTDQSWQIINDQEWLNMNIHSGNGNAILIFTAKNNTSFKNRRTTVAISSPNMPNQSIVVNQESAPVTVTAGNLKNLFSSSERSSMTKLTVNGEIDARDFKIIRDEMPLLEEIDLSNVSICPYSGQEGTGDILNFNYPKNAIPNNAFSSVNKSMFLRKVTLPVTLTEIDCMAFGDCVNLESIEFPPSLTTIGNDAFFNCSMLQSVKFPASVKSIGSFSFYCCTNIDSIFIPSNTSWIGDDAFSGSCKSAFEVDPTNLYYSCSDGVLLNKTKTTLIKCPLLKSGSYNIPYTVTNIDNMSFFECKNLKSVLIPSSVKDIGTHAFCSANLTTITIPLSVTHLSNGSFIDNKILTSVYVFNNIPIDITWGESPVFIYQMSKRPPITLYVPYGSKALYETANEWKDFSKIVEMPEFKLSTTNVTIKANEGSSAYIDVTTKLVWNIKCDQTWLSVTSSSIEGMQRITFTATANQVIGNRLALATISTEGIPDQTIIITQEGLSKTLDVVAGNLQSLLTTNELSSIIQLTLSGTIDARDFKTMRALMTQLKEVDLTNVKIVEYTGTEGTYYSANTIPANAFASHVNLQSVIFPKNTVGIGLLAFYDCNKLTSIDIPASITNIERQAFYSCDKLDSIFISSFVSSIGENAFTAIGGQINVDKNNQYYSSSDGILFNKDRTTLIQCPVKISGSYIIPSTVKKIGSNAFNSCNKINSIIIPPSVNEIQNAAFIGCKSLTTIVIPSSVNSIGSQGFGYISSLTSLYSMGKIPIDLSNKWEVFEGIPYACTLFVPYGSKALYAAANQWKYFRNIVEFDATGVENLSAELIKLYPNPIDDYLNIELGTLTNCSIRIINILGQTVYTSPVHSQKMDINMSKVASSGLYYIQVIDIQKNVIATKKLLKK